MHHQVTVGLSFICLYGFLPTALWFALLIIANRSYYENLRKLDAKKKLQEQAAKKKKPKEFKWPENLPHHDLYL